MHLATILITLLLPSAGAPSSAPGPDYLGQALPGREPALFAPGIVGTGLATRDLAIAPDGSEIYFGVFLPGFRKAAIAVVRREGGRWSAPEVAAFSRDGRFRHLEPCISPDGQRLFFTSDRPADPAASAPGPFGIWVMAREGAGWGEPRRLPAEVNGAGNSFYASVTRDGTLYFLREEGEGGWIMRSALRDGAWRPAEKLPPPFNADPHQVNPRIDPDGRYLLVPMIGRSDSLGGADYYAFFRRDDGGWVGPVHLGAPLSSAAADEFSVTPSPDGKVLFFGSNRALPRLDAGPLRWADLLAERTLAGNGATAIWWMDAGILAEARARALGLAGP